MTRVLIASPFFLRESALERRFRTFSFPLGLLYLAGAARAAGHEVAVFDGTFAAGDDAFSAALRQHDPGVVCIGSWITVRGTALRLAGLVRAEGRIVVAGGPGPTADPDIYINHPAVEVVVRGEGERTLVDLLAALESGADFASVAGIVYREGGMPVRTAERAAITDLDTLPRPARDLIDVDRHLGMWQAAHGYRSLTLALTRGCPDPNCPFCARGPMGSHLRRRSAADAAAEMREIEAAYDIDRFRLVDDLNRLERDMLVALGEAMIAAGVTTPYEGLNPVTHEDLPMLAEVKDICAERNAWLPTKGKHGHAPPVDDEALLRRRWELGILLENEHLEDP
jgi:anaerobic magnesium-protoporphyrin IX monomethyl ester cyclase